MDLISKVPPPGGWKPYSAPAAPTKSLRQIVEEENARRPKPLPKLKVERIVRTPGMIPRCDCGRPSPHTGVPCLGAKTPSVIPIPSPAPLLCACGLPSPHKGRVCLPVESLAPKAKRGRKKNPPKDPNLCIIAGCTNPRRRYVYGPDDCRIVAHCDQHCDELKAYRKRRYDAMRAANPLPPRQPKPPKDESLCVNNGCTRPRKVQEGGHVNQRCVECSDAIAAKQRARYEASHPMTPEELAEDAAKEAPEAAGPLKINFSIDPRNRGDIEAAAKASGFSVEEWAAQHLLWAATLRRDAKSHIEQQEADFKAEVQRCLDQLVADGEISIVGEQDGEKLYAKK